MRRQIRIAVAAAVAIGAASVLLLAASAPAPAQSVGEHIANYAVTMDLQPDGGLVVDEQISYDFGATPKHGIYRDLVERETYDAHDDREYRISDLTARIDKTNTPVQTSTSGNYLRARIGDPNVTVTGLHTYTIDYRLEGAARTFPDHQELYWDAIGNQWSVPIDRASVTVNGPAAISEIACFSGAQGSSLPCASATRAGRSARFSQVGLGPDEGLTVVVGLPSGSIVPAPQPILVRRRTVADAFAVRPNTLIPAIALAVIAIGSTLWLAARRGRDRRYVGSAVDAAFGNTTGREQPARLGGAEADPVEFVPPDGVLPGQVGTLVDEHANLVDVTATIVDLAVRGWLTITDLDHDYELTKATSDGKGTLVPYETALLGALFQTGTEVRLSELQYKFRAALAEIQDAMYGDVVAEGWFRIRPDRTRQRWTFIALGALVGTIALTIAVAVTTSFGLVPAALVLGAITLIAVAHQMPSRTAKGSAMLSRVRGFRRLFDEGDQGLREKFAEQHDIFSKYLPYAIVFGCTDKWARVFAQLDAQQLDTSWYHGTAPFNAILLASSIDNFRTAATGTLYASAPSSSTGSGFGGGFSGFGGFSGGGGGGGGGGSW